MTDDSRFAKQRARERFGPKKIEKPDMLGSFLRHGITQKEAEAETIVEMYEKLYRQLKIS